ncbi:winged helix-turn-helix transcriptional regulator [Sinomicrobium weinanense]|uniref:Winged helix-turn-helix transcriptional regulator n=1 Tax=Sinomicrobium weinanense TaxID=2842200 RepID=A0A926JRJ9_9FLAO|nr:winged helix-turn-helix transcriptional regulator [Sinomicrobium weinanense]MBC9796138.1 winged helix-turn-helix transcriptional regulator [Sinomicrobium weinanense]MBU3121889.1 winged helix-turn-helix transcriptional regulator [Sinomicrobium weinanense]
MGQIKKTSTNYENRQILDSECDEIYAANLIGGRWTIAICCYLADGKLRFSQLRKRMPNITERMLTLHLRKMEANRLVKRTVYAEVPPRVEYELTESGQQLMPILDQLRSWGRKHKQKTQTYS